MQPYNPRYNLEPIYISDTTVVTPQSNMYSSPVIQQEPILVTPTIYPVSRLPNVNQNVGPITQSGRTFVPIGQNTSSTIRYGNENIGQNRMSIIPSIAPLATSDIQVPLPIFKPNRNIPTNITDPVYISENVSIVNPVRSRMNPLLSLEERELQTAINRSLEDVTTLETKTLEEAIRSSVVSTQQLQREQDRRNMNDRDIMFKQDQEYQESIRLDKIKEENKVQEENIRRAVEEANTAVEEAARKLLLAEKLKKDMLQPPILKYSSKTLNDTYVIKFKLPDGTTINHSFHKREPLSSIMQQLKYDLKHLGSLILTDGQRSNIICPLDTSIEECGLRNRMVVFVDYD